MEQKNNVDAILFHIEHSKPIEISEFVTSLNAIGNLFSLFAKKNGDCKEAAKSKLYVEKIEEGNSAQNQLEKEIKSIKSVQPVTDMYSRQLMTIYQMRSDMETDKGNMAVSDAISKNKMAVVFETDELKEMILHSDSNPTKKAYLVDVVLLTVNGKIAAYKVMALHDVIDLE